MRSPRIEQHRQPDDIRMVSSFASSTSKWSRPISPNSLITTAVSAMSACCSRFLSKVVLPEPRNPVMTETGSRSSSGASLMPMPQTSTSSLGAAQAVQGIEAEREQDEGAGLVRDRQRQRHHQHQGRDAEHRLTQQAERQVVEAALHIRTELGAAGAH